MNISGTLNVFRLFREPVLCLPQHTVSTFNHLPVPLSKAFPKKDGEKDVDIKAVVLDKDNCFAIPHTNEVHKPYHVSRRMSHGTLGSQIGRVINKTRKNSKSSERPILGLNYS